MTQELDTNKHRVIDCVKFLKSIIIYKTLLQSDHKFNEKNKQATFLTHRVYHSELYILCEHFHKVV